MATSAELLEDVHVLLIAKEPIDTDNVRMVHEGVNFQLSNELLVDILGLHELFGNDLHCTDKPCVLVLDYEYLSVHSFT